MKIPAKVSVPIYIEQGLVCWYKVDVVNNNGTSYSGDRFMIVLNANPKTDTVIILTTITKQIAKKEKYIQLIGESPETLVALEPSDFSRLKHKSVVNCNDIYESSLSDLIDKIDDGGKVFAEKLTKDIVSSIVKGVLMSNQVSTEHKKLII